jgi:prepilin-type N-terminal cleavage/methylation domain-containing protein
MKGEDMKRKQGFTLIEMLVVIAILILLMGIVYAVMGPSREQGRQAVCISNLRQIGQALAMYRSDYDGVDATGQPVEWWDLGMPPGFVYQLVQQGYIKDKRILFCPSDHDPERKRAFSSYIMEFSNWIIASQGGRSGRPPFREVIAQRGERLVILFCGEHNFPGPRETKPNLRILLRLNGEVERRQMTNEKPPWQW